jgi:hypothetical protein
MEKRFNIAVGNNKHQFLIKKKKKKSITISIEHGKSVVVTIPFSVKYEKALEIINQKIEWIEKSLRKAAENYSEIEKIEKKFESKILFCGMEYQLEDIENREKSGVEVSDGKIKIYSSNGKNAGKLKKWYVENAKQLIQSRHEYYEKITGLKAAEVKFRQMSNWGICSSKQKITYNIKLVSAPIDVIDYVVLHEIIHLKHLNHSKEFWSEVIKYMPDFYNKKEWLKKNGRFIEFTSKKINES